MMSFEVDFLREEPPQVERKKTVKFSAPPALLNRVLKKEPDNRSGNLNCAEMNFS
jgi:hypothetical protein